MIPRKNEIFKGEAREVRQQQIFAKKICRGVRNEVTMTI
jgi:hypothetical protein